VMPGVLMLHALAEAGAWLWRQTTDYEHTVIVLRSVRNLKYGTFMQPGGQMRILAELAEVDGPLAHLKGKGEVDGAATVSARLTLCRYNLSDRNPALASADERIVASLRERYRMLCGELAPSPLPLSPETGERGRGEGAVTAG